MFGNIDPRKMSALMKQMGLSQTEIDASRVIIERADNSKIIINNPNVVKMKMQGQESFQITGDIEELAEEDNSKEKFEEDIQSIIDQTGVTKDIAAIELEKNNGDIAETIINLSKKK